jgi:hypothetical protein
VYRRHLVSHFFDERLFVCLFSLPSSIERLSSTVL